MGAPPHRFFMSRRTETAKNLLADPELSVTRIGQELGFSETSAFTTTFRRHSGLTPTAYRRSRLPNRAFGTLHDPLPTGVTGSRSRPTPPGFGQILCRPDAWFRVSFAHTRVSILGWIYDPDHSLPPGMYVDVPHLDCLLVAALITVEGLDQLILKPKQLDGITAVYVDVVVGHVAMALSKKS
jgi:hypothetical protein